MTTTIFIFSPIVFGKFTEHPMVKFKGTVIAIILFSSDCVKRFNKRLSVQFSHIVTLQNFAFVRHFRLQNSLEWVIMAYYWKINQREVLEYG